MSDSLAGLMSEANRLRFEDPHEAHRLYADAVAQARQLGSRLALITALKALGQIDRDLNRGDAALPLYEEAVALCRQEDDPLLLAHTIRHLADIHQDAGREGLAEPCYDEALSIYRNHHQTSALDLANAIRPLALLKESQHEYETAKRLFAEARDLYAACNIAEGVAEMSRRAARL